MQPVHYVLLGFVVWASAIVFIISLIGEGAKSNTGYDRDEPPASKDDTH